MEKYFGLFSGREDLENMWSGPLGDVTVIAAIYTDEDYCGDAMVVFRKEGKLYEAHCSHCSCNGLEAWQPEETVYEALLDRLDRTEEYMQARYGADFFAAVRKGLIDEMFEREVLVS